MFEGMIVFSNFWPSKSLESSPFSSVGKGGFRILSITFGRLYKASLILVELKPTLAILSYNPTHSSMANTVSFQHYPKI